MKRNFIAKMIETYIVALIGGYLFFLMNLPLPWILGPIPAILMWKSITKRILVSYQPFRNGGFMLLGIGLGLFFTPDTFSLILPYLIPYTMMTILLIGISIVNSVLISKFINLNTSTSIMGSIPGGLSTMVAASESLGANVAMVTILQTIRLLAVLFTIPFLIVHMFTGSTVAVSLALGESGSDPTTFLSFGWYVIAGLIGYLLRNKLPAAYVVGPLSVVALLSAGGIALPSLPLVIIIWAQLAIGIHIGNQISVKELKQGGKYGGIFLLSAMVLIFIAFGLGYFLMLMTDLSLADSILSVAPGGLVEMALTSAQIGGDPSVVSSLQLIRLLIIVIFVPSFVQWLFKRNELRKVKV